MYLCVLRLGRDDRKRGEGWGGGVHERDTDELHVIYWGCCSFLCGRFTMGDILLSWRGFFTSLKEYVHHLGNKITQ